MGIWKGGWCSKEVSERYRVGLWKAMRKLCAMFITKSSFLLVMERVPSSRKIGSMVVSHCVIPPPPPLPLSLPICLSWLKGGMVGRYVEPVSW